LGCNCAAIENNRGDMDENAEIAGINNGQQNCAGVLFLEYTAVVLLVRFLGIQEDVFFFRTEN